MVPRNRELCHALHPGAIQVREGIKFCPLATLCKGTRWRSTCRPSSNDRPTGQGRGRPGRERPGSSRGWWATGSSRRPTRSSSPRNWGRLRYEEFANVLGLFYFYRIIYLGTGWPFRFRCFIQEANSKSLNFHGFKRFYVGWDLRDKIIWSWHTDCETPCSYRNKPT